MPVAADRRAVRLAPAGRAVGGLVLLVTLAVVTALVAWWLAQPREHPLPPRAQTVGAPFRAGPSPSTPVGSPGTSGTDGSAGATAAVTLLVHVAGAVRHPGVVELAAGSRVTDALEAAGGVTRRAATASVNLARPVVDGEQVVVLRRGVSSTAVAPGPAGVAGGPVQPGGAAGPVDLNTASLDQLDGLPGIGPVLAQRILDWRTSHGRFSTVDELGEVSGIGEATLADLRPVVRV